MVLAVPVDADLVNVSDVSQVRLAVKTPDQKVILITPKATDFCGRGNHCYRLFTSALMSHPVWSEALHVEVSVVLDHNEAGGGRLASGPSSAAAGLSNFVPLCDPVKVLVLPKPIKRGI